MATEVLWASSSRLRCTPSCIRECTAIDVAKIRSPNHSKRCSVDSGVIGKPNCREQRNTPAFRHRRILSYTLAATHPWRRGCKRAVQVLPDHVVLNCGHFLRQCGSAEVWQGSGARLRALSKRCEYESISNDCECEEDRRFHPRGRAAKAPGLPNLSTFRAMAWFSGEL